MSASARERQHPCDTQDCLHPLSTPRRPAAFKMIGLFSIYDEFSTLRKAHPVLYKAAEGFLVFGNRQQDFVEMQGSLQLEKSVLKMVWKLLQDKGS